MTTLTSLCKSCGATIEYTAELQAPQCPYCGAVVEIAKKNETIPDAAAKIIPLTVTKEQLERAVYHYIASGDYTPDDLVATARITKTEFIYVPTYLCSVQYAAKWTASFGDDRMESYIVIENSKEITRHRTVTDWYFASGDDAGIFNLITHAGAPLPDPKSAEVVENCRGVEAVVDYDANYVTNIEVGAYKTNEVDAFAQAKARVDQQIEKGVKSHARGDRQRDWAWTSDVSRQYSTTLVPFCSAHFVYRGQTYVLWVDGSDTKHFVADPLPQDKDRLSYVGSGYWPARVTLLAMLACGHIKDGHLFDGFSWVGFGTYIALKLYAMLRKRHTIAHSKQIRAEILARVDAVNTPLQNLSDADRQKTLEVLAQVQPPLLAKSPKDRVLIPLLCLGAMYVVYTHTGPFPFDVTPNSYTYSPASSDNAQPRSSNASGTASSAAASTATASSAESTSPDNPPRKTSSHHRHHKHHKT